MATVNTPRNLPKWSEYFGNAGDCYQLAYQAPNADKCRADRAAYTQLIKQWGLVSKWPAHTQGVYTPPGGFERIGTTLFCMVSLPRGARLGELLPRTLTPCGDSSQTRYTLQSVTIVLDAQELTGLHHVINLASTVNMQVQDVAERALTAPVELVKDTAGAVGDAAGNALSVGAQVLVRGISPLIVPAVILVALWAVVHGGLKRTDLL